uniref:Endothelial cell-specific chemotaxis regulator n=1 Tax=Sus scrofa TaxID=9823 RepID=A0A8D0S5P4_PIG
MSERGCRGARAWPLPSPLPSPLDLLGAQGFSGGIGSVGLTNLLHPQLPLPVLAGESPSAESNSSSPLSSSTSSSSNSSSSTSTTDTPHNGTSTSPTVSLRTREDPTVLPSPTSETVLTVAAFGVISFIVILLVVVIILVSVVSLRFKCRRNKESEDPQKPGSSGLSESCSTANGEKDSITLISMKNINMNNSKGCPSAEKVLFSSSSHSSPSSSSSSLRLCFLNHKGDIFRRLRLFSAILHSLAPEQFTHPHHVFILQVL